jgi:hypothetical protein
VHYYLSEAPKGEITLRFLDAESNEIKSFEIESAGVGLNRFEWDMRYPDAVAIDGGTFIYRGSLRGPAAVPGSYQVNLTVDGQSSTRPLKIVKDPRTVTTQEDLQKQFDLLIRIRDALSSAHDAVNRIVDINNELEATKKRVRGLESEKAVSDHTDRLKNKLVSVLDALVELKVRSYREFNFYLFHPMFNHHRLKLNVRIGSIQGVVAGSDRKPTDQSYENFEEASEDLDIQLEVFEQILEKDIPEFNKLVREAGVPAISVREK